jgi:hypothetical protein
MNTLIIYTNHPRAVQALLESHELVDSLPTIISPLDSVADRMEYHYPDDLPGQALTFWFALAQGCGLISEEPQLIHQQPEPPSQPTRH